MIKVGSVPDRGRRVSRRNRLLQERQRLFGVVELVINESGSKPHLRILGREV